MVVHVIYRICTGSGEYIGRSSNFPSRVCGHWWAKNKRGHKLRVTRALDSESTIQVEGVYDCETLKEIALIERMWMDRVGATLNVCKKWKYDSEKAHRLEAKTRREDIVIHEGVANIEEFTKVQEGLRQTLGGEVSRKCPERAGPNCGPDHPKPLVGKCPVP